MNAMANTAAEKHAAQGAPALQMKTLPARSSSCRSSRRGVAGMGKRRMYAFIPGPPRVGKADAAFGRGGAEESQPGIRF